MIMGWLGQEMVLGNCQCLFWLMVGQGHTVFSVGVGGINWIVFSCLSFVFSFSLSLGNGLI